MGEHSILRVAERKLGCQAFPEAHFAIDVDPAATEVDLLEALQESQSGTMVSGGIDLVKI